MSTRGSLAPFSALVVIGLATLAHAQETEQKWFYGVITGERVNIRAGAGQNYYPVTQLDAGTIVKVYDDLYGWYKIDPPAGSFSYIKQEYVDADPSGKTGSVKGGKVRVRAPSPGGPLKSYRTQDTLEDGATIEILGVEGEWYKIKPTPNAKLYVKKDFVETATAEQVAAWENAPATTEPSPDTPVTDAGPRDPVPVAPPVIKPKDDTADPDPGADPGTTVAETLGGEPQPPAGVAGQDPPKPAEIARATEPDPGTDPGIDPGADPGQDPGAGAGADPVARATEPMREIEPPVTVPDPLEPADLVVQVDPGDSQVIVEDDPLAGRTATVRANDPKLAELELRIKELDEQPLKDQPLAALRLDYEQLLATESLSKVDTMLVKSRIDLLATRQQLQQSMREIDRVKEELEAKRQQRAAEEAAKPKKYIAVGRLTASTVYTGDRLPLLYRLVDPLNGLTIAYVAPPKDREFSEVVGQYVGVAGQKEFDSALKLFVIREASIDTLAPSKQP